MLLAFVLALLFAAPASAYVPAPPNVQFVQGAMPGDATQDMAAAATDGAAGVIYYQEPLSAYARAHEVGHVFDHQVLSDGDRRYFARLMQVPRASTWRAGTGSAGMASPSEWFADYYAAAATGLDPRRGGVASYATIGERRLKRFERALARIGRRLGLRDY